MTTHTEALEAAIIAAGFDPRNPAVREAWQAGIAKYLEMRNGEAVKASIDTMREAARDVLLKRGWKAGDKMPAISVIGLMAEFGMQVYRGEVGCGYPDCGCDADAACKDAIDQHPHFRPAAPVSAGGEKVKERDRCASIAADEAVGVEDGEYWIALRIRNRILDPSDDPSASDEAGERSEPAPGSEGPDMVTLTADEGCKPSSAPSAGGEKVKAMPCPCTTFEQDEDCPVGFPSLLCAACKGTGVAPVDQVVALAAEMMKIAEQVDELEDPFAAWETIDLIKSQHSQLRNAVEELKFALFSADMTIRDRADQAARLVLAATVALSHPEQPTSVPSQFLPDVQGNGDMPFIPAVIENRDAGISELVIEDTPTVTGREMVVRPLYRMSGRQIIGFQWDTALASLTTDDRKEKGR